MASEAIKDGARQFAAGGSAGQSGLVYSEQEALRQRHNTFFPKRFIQNGLEHLLGTSGSVRKLQYCHGRGVRPSLIREHWSRNDCNYGNCLKTCPSKKVLSILLALA